ncbi:MAG: N-6 DNA methylase, partial [Clostridiales Family XIII bacterium]|nr:N-6 DNA methylase [Clostridiales Family XIII bacterium]
MSKHLDSIIKRLGYAESSCLKRRSDGYNSSDLTMHTIKVLNELFPYAVYMTDNEPFVMFFDEPSNQDAQKAIHRKIWNAQIPVAIFCGADAIKVFNGCTINKDTHLLPETKKLAFDIIDENSPFSFWEITNQNFWKDYVSYFNDKKLNDDLLDNLTYLTDKLKNTYHVPFATKLVLRLIFIRYLIDRGVDLDYQGFSS